jgi:hypothetical protein
MGKSVVILTYTVEPEKQVFLNSSVEIFYESLQIAFDNSQ